MNAPLQIRNASPDDFEAWSDLYTRYAREINLPVTDAVTQIVWRWILEGTHRVESLLATRGNVCAGFATFRPFPRTLDGNEACFLDDLYVREEFRGTGVVRALIGRVVAIARERDWTHVRWVTTSDNLRAQGLYDKIAEKMDLITYRIEIRI